MRLASGLSNPATRAICGLGLCSGNPFFYLWRAIIPETIQQGAGRLVHHDRRTQYREAARTLGHELAARGIGLVYGGASIGVMGAIANAVLEKDGEVVEPHPDFRILATANTLGNGDDSRLYAGTQVMNEAFKDRFTTVIHLDYPEEKTEIEILTKKVSKLKKTELRRMVKCARQVREAFERDECGCTFSTRRLLAFASKYAQLGNISTALELTVLNKLSRDDRSVVAEITQRHLGSLLNSNTTQTNNTKESKGE